MSHTCKRHCDFYTVYTNKSLFPVYTSTLFHTQTSNKHASSLWSTDTPGPDYCQITTKLQAFHSSAAHSHSDCSSCFLNSLKRVWQTRERERKPVPVPARRHDKHTCSQRCTHTSISWWVTLFIGRPLHKERMQGLKITVIISMESAAHPCLVGRQRQVHMTPLSQVELSCCDLLKCVTSWGRNCIGKKWFGTACFCLAGGVVQKSGDSAQKHTHTHRPAGAVCFSECSVSLCACVTWSSGKRELLHNQTHGHVCVHTPTNTYL